MRPVILLALLSGFFTNSRGQEPVEYHKAEQGLFGKVRFMAEKRYDALQTDGEIVKGPLRGNDTYSYNQAGCLLENTTSNADGLIRRDVHRYENDQNRVEEIRYDSDGALVYRNTYLYDEKGNQVEKTVHDDRGKPQFRIHTTYDDRGAVLKIKKTYVSLPAPAKTIVENSYDDHGRLIEERMSDLMGPVRIQYRYDEQGRKIEMNLYQSKKKLVERQTFVYDGESRLIENVIYQGNDMLTGKILCEYDERGNLSMKSRFASDGQLLERETHEFQYDPSGNLVMENHFRFYQGTAETSEISEYSNFDKMGNWQWKLQSRNGIAEALVEREIKYYEEND